MPFRVGVRSPCGFADRARVANGVSDPHADPPDPGMLDEIARRVLWLAVRMVDVANREWGSGDGVRVGGHQASSASAATTLTTLYLAHLDPAVG